MFYIANCTLETQKSLGNEMDLVSKVSGMKSSADSVRVTTSSVQITGLRNPGVNVQARQNVTVTGPNSGSKVGGNAGHSGNQVASHVVPISQSSVKQATTGGATLTLIPPSTVSSGGSSTPGGLVLTRPHLSSSPSHHVQHHQLHQQSTLISVATGTTYHVPRGAAAVANIAAPRSAVASPIIRASSASGLQVSGGPSGSSGLSGATCVGYTPGGALLRPASSPSPSATILPRITSPPASSISTTTMSSPSSVTTSVVASSGAPLWASNKTLAYADAGVLVQPQSHHARASYSQLRTVTTKVPLHGHRLQVEVSPVRTTCASATSSSHAASISSSSSSIASINKQPISQHVAQLHIPDKSYFKSGGTSSSGAVTIAQVLPPKVGTVSGLNSAPSISSSSGNASAFPVHFTPVSSPLPGRPSLGTGPSPVSTTSSTTTAPAGLHALVSTTRIALAGPRGHQQLVGPKVIAQPVHGPSSIQITQVPVQVPSSPTTTQQHSVSSTTSASSSTSTPAPSQSPQHLPLQTIQTQQAPQATIHTVVPLSAVHQQPHTHPVQQHQAHQGTAIAITTVVTRALTYAGPAVPGTVVAGSTLGRSATMVSVPAIPSPSSSVPTTSTISMPSPISTNPPVTSVTSAAAGVSVGKVFTSPLGTLSRVGLEVTTAGDHPADQPLVSLQQGQHQTTPGVYIQTSHPRASPAPQITAVPRGERSQMLVGGNSTTIIQQQHLSSSPSPPSTLSSTVPSSTISSTSSSIAVVTTTNTAATYALPTTTYYYGGSSYAVGVARPFSGSGPGGPGSAVTAISGNGASSFVPIQAVSATVISSSSGVASASPSVVTVAPASPASLTTIRPVGQSGLTTHQVHGIMTTGSGPVRFNPVMVVDSTRSTTGGPPFLSEGQFVEVPGAGNGIVSTHFSNSALQTKHLPTNTTLAPPPAPSASVVSVQASPIKPNSSPRPSILRKRDCDGTPMKAQKNLGPTLAALSSSIGSTASAASATPLASLGSSQSPPPSPSLGTGNHHSSSSPTSSSSSSSSSSSAGSTTISATSSPGGEVDVGEDSLPPQLLAPPVPGSSSVVKTEPMDDSHPPTETGNTQPRPFLPVPPPTQVVVEMSPRKKPRKQQLTGNELQEPKFSEDEMEFISESKIKKEVKNGDSASISASTSVPVVSTAPIHVSAPQPIVTKRPSNMSLLNGYRHAWKSRHNHFIRPGDVRPREERRPSVADIAAQRRVLQKLNGWKVHHLSSQMEELAELEMQVFYKLTEMLRLMERKQSGGKELEKDVNRINELIKGNIQRSLVIKDQMHEAKSQVMKIFEHKELVSDILSKSASKRSAKKREKS